MGAFSESMVLVLNRQAVTEFHFNSTSIPRGTRALLVLCFFEAANRQCTVRPRNRRYCAFL